MLIDFEGRELAIARRATEVFGPDLYAVRIDTSADRIHEGGHDKLVPELVAKILERSPDKNAALKALDHYGFGPGVTVESVYNVRKALDDAGAKNTKIIVTSGFTADKVSAFTACNAPMDAIGTGSWVSFLIFTSDIIRVFEDGRWIPRCKAGRGDIIALPDLPAISERN